MVERTESSILVEASPAQVIDVIADFPSYPQWAREMTSAEVLSEEGDGWPDQVRFTLNAGVLRDTYVLDYDWDVVEDGSGVVTWTLVRATALKSLDGSYTLRAVPGRDGAATQVTYRLSVELKFPMVDVLRRKAEEMLVSTALRELKNRVEA